MDRYSIYIYIHAIVVVVVGEYGAILAQNLLRAYGSCYKLCCFTNVIGILERERARAHVLAILKWLPAVNGVLVRKT